MNYIENLADNYPKKNRKTQTMDLVLEGGSCNGSYLLGSLLLIKEFEKRNYIKISKISGSSIGSFMAFYYVSDNLRNWLNDSKMLRKYFIKNLNLSYMKNLLNKYLNDMSKKEFNKIKNNKLFITYSDINKSEKIIKSVFKSKKELRDTILKSCHIPTITNKDFFFKDKDNLFFDGGFPFIFKNRTENDNKILYISLSNISLLKNMITVKNEENVYGRTLEGMLDVYKFFMYDKNTTMCSYVNNWTLHDYIILYLKEIIYKLALLISIYTYKLKDTIYPYLKDTIIYKEFYPIIKKFSENLILLYCI